MEPKLKMIHRRVLYLRRRSNVFLWRKRKKYGGLTSQEKWKFAIGSLFVIAVITFILYLFFRGISILINHW